MTPTVIPDVIAVGRYECPDCGYAITLEHTRSTADAWCGAMSGGFAFVCPCRLKVELLAAVTVEPSLVDETSAARDTASTPSSGAKREEWRRRAVSFAAWLAVGLAIGAVFCSAWAIAEWGWAR